MEIFFFRSTPDHELFGFTFHPRGANLPNEFAPWQEAGGVSTLAAIAADIVAVIKRDGGYLSRSCSTTVSDSEQNRSVNLAMHLRLSVAAPVV
jgi:hypothetical protein